MSDAEAKASELLNHNTILEGKIVQLRNDLENNRNMLNMLINEEKPVRRKVQDVKTIFYKEHKNDKDVHSMVEQYKLTFPQLRVPWQFLKCLTDRKLKQQNECVTEK
jgi:hypothetical protein